MTCKNNSVKKRAFTLIELLIVIAIIGILFIVLVSKVDFATDKAKATGVQTDFRSFQVALEQVAKENAGFNTFGWDTGDLNGDRIRNSYDVGDTNQDGVRDANETWTGRKEYVETWTGIYTLVNPASADDKTAIYALEAAINKNLDPKLHITIHEDLTITMANQATDPWKNEYHGRYITNATADGLDRGAILIYSNGANGKNGTADGIAGGLVNITVPGSNVQGKDDYVLATFYTKANGYGEVKTITYGFSNNQTFNDASDVPVTPSTDVPSMNNNLNIEYEMLSGNNQDFVLGANTDLEFRSAADYDDFVGVLINGTELDSSNYTVREGSTIVTIKADYLNTLATGSYEVTIKSKDGSAKATFACDEAEIITFTLNGTAYQCNAGTTWGEWIRSDANTTSWTIDEHDGYVWCDGITYLWDATYSQQYHESDVILAQAYQGDYRGYDPQ